MSDCDRFQSLPSQGSSQPSGLSEHRAIAFALNSFLLLYVFLVVVAFYGKSISVTLS